MRKQLAVAMLVVFATTAWDALDGSVTSDSGLRAQAAPSIVPQQQTLAASKVDGHQLLRADLRGGRGDRTFRNEGLRADLYGGNYVFLSEDERCGPGSWPMSEC